MAGVARGLHAGSVKPSINLSFNPWQVSPAAFTLVQSNPPSISPSIRGRCRPRPSRWFSQTRQQSLLQSVAGVPRGLHAGSVTPSFNPWQVSPAAFTLVQSIPPPIPPSVRVGFPRGLHAGSVNPSINPSISLCRCPLWPSRWFSHSLLQSVAGVARGLHAGSVKPSINPWQVSPAAFTLVQSLPPLIRGRCRPRPSRWFSHPLLQSVAGVPCGLQAGSVTPSFNPWQVSSAVFRLVQSPPPSIRGRCPLRSSGWFSQTLHQSVAGVPCGLQAGSVTPSFNPWQVSPAAFTPELSDRAEYPTFFRTRAALTTFNPARIAFVRAFGWRRVAILTRQTNYFIKVSLVRGAHHQQWDIIREISSVILLSSTPSLSAALLYPDLWVLWV